MTDRPEIRERAVLVHLQLKPPYQTADLQESLALSISAGAEVVTTLICPRSVPDVKYFIGSGKVEELRGIVATEKIEVVLFDHTLSPSQERNLERELRCRVVDRTRLILDIFAKRARTFEGKLQVEVAQLKHHSTRLIRGWTHLERQKGGIGLRGPGETQLEVDRRLIRKRLKYLDERLEKVKSQREQSRRTRHRAELPTISLVGYTNAGKSTLFNALTGADVYVANKLFATLDPTLKGVKLESLGQVIFADTVGFITKLPHDLIEAFKATLEEVREADLLLHVIDVADESRDLHIRQVETVLEEIGALAVPRIEVYNKIDLLEGLKPHFERNQEGRVTRVYVSATARLGLADIRAAIVEFLGQDRLRGVLHLEPKYAEIRALLYEAEAVREESLDEEGCFDLHLVLSDFKWQQLCNQYPFLSENWKEEG